MSLSQARLSAMIQDSGAVTAQGFPAPVCPGPGCFDFLDFLDLQKAHYDHYGPFFANQNDSIANLSQNPCLSFTGGRISKLFAKSFAKNTFANSEKHQGVSCCNPSGLGNLKLKPLHGPLERLQHVKYMGILWNTTENGNVMN